ncbi:hypothetical protein [Aeromonas veronii]|uniref:hypothetical protein n=1 Tax=Aeromonas veronii TaxID=654 RepID=UPI0035B71DD4
MQDFFKGFELDMALIKQHYTKREVVSLKLNRLLHENSLKEYSELAVGVSDPYGNFSAAEHALGPKILHFNSYESIFSLAKKLSQKDIKAKVVADHIYKANLPYLKIGVGSEMACLLQPDECWVGNVRTIWCHLVVKHKGDWQKANNELDLYRIDDITSEMNYKIWSDIYVTMKSNLNIIHDLSLSWAKEVGVEAGCKKYLWVDTVCSHLYDCE